jgi:hypothetical protein
MEPSMTRSMTILIALAALAGLAGCDSVIINNQTVQTTYRNGDEDYAARFGAIRVEVLGETFGVPPDRFASLVVAQMREAGHHPEKTMFTTEASRETDPRFKIVMMFNPATAVSGDGLCNGAQQREPRPAGSVKLLAAFCGGNALISESAGRAGRITRVEDPQFHQLVEAVTQGLFPTSDFRYATPGF